MVNFIEEELAHCKKCDRTTKHLRNNSKSSGFMLLVHLLLSVVTGGIWFILAIICRAFGRNPGAWMCSECIARPLNEKL